MLFSLGLNLVLILTLTLPIYYRRHRRQDLVLAFLVVNIGVFALTEALSGMSLGAGFGIGLFGVLSIIRLRSSEIDQRDVAYYFASLVIGLVCALTTIETPQIGLLGVLVVVLLLLADRSGNSHALSLMRLTLDRAYLDQAAVNEALDKKLGQKVVTSRIISINEVNDSTVVDVIIRNCKRERAHR